MGQVPAKKYLIVGNGRLANHISYYLNNQNHIYDSWMRSSSLKDLDLKLEQADIILLAISDDSILDFFQRLEKGDKYFVHFSGKFYHPEIYGFHPLMTFSNELYEKDFYQYVPFVGDAEEIYFRQIFPEWQNPYYQISPEYKTLYHGLCVLAGNGTNLLWELFQQKIQELSLPAEIGDLFLLKISQNIIQQKEGRLTGPWYRNDRNTMTAHLSDLKKIELDSLYNELYKLSQKLLHEQGTKYGGRESTTRV